MGECYKKTEKVSFSGRRIALFNNDYLSLNSIGFNFDTYSHHIFPSPKKKFPLATPMSIHSLTNVEVWSIASSRFKV